MENKQIFIICPTCKTKNFEYEVCYQDDKLVEFRINCVGCKGSITHRDSIVAAIMPAGVMDKTMMKDIIDQVKESFGFPKNKDGKDFQVK
jgi:hypothetical protein